MHLRPSDQRGFTLPAVIGIMAVALIFAGLAYGAANGGRASSGATRDGKQAYAAAESGINWYLSRLVADNAYWSRCTSVKSAAAPVNNPWSGVGTDPRQWRTIPDSSGATAADYTIELLPANGAAACSQADPNGTFVDTATRTFQIRSTGRYGRSKRAIVASFRRTRFLDFVYLTEYETTDPINYQGGSGFSTADYDDACGGKLRPAREAARVRNSNGQVVKQCQEIQFINADEIQGPLHSNDSLLTCGSPKFGRTDKADKIQVAAAAPGYVRSCSGTPTFRTPLQTSVSPILMPETFKSISDAVASNYRFTGRTFITLNNDTITVRRNGSATDTTMPWPSNGLIYVDGDSTCTADKLEKPASMTYNSASLGCADAYVSGTYDRNITIASANDVVAYDAIRGKSGTDAVAGLIADRFVRVLHPVSTNSDGACVNNDAYKRPDLRIDAAILAVSHSFTVDNYDCGAGLGDLTVKGGIAQNYRGAVGTSGGTGYEKNYLYDDRFVYRSPPFFLEPAAAAWSVVRIGEQSAAR